MGNPGTNLKIMNHIIKDDLPVDTPVMVCDFISSSCDWKLRYYADKRCCFVCNNKSVNEAPKMRWRYIIPFESFNPNDIEESLKYNIVK